MKEKMKTYQVVEKFVSINGEGRYAGKLATFIRLKGCNLKCSYCDTCWANKENVTFESMTKEEIHTYITQNGVRHVTITGGEPLLQPNINELLEELCKDQELQVEVETNGSKSILPYANLPVSFTVDYKLPDSGMEEYMEESNYVSIRENDTIKFVCCSEADLERAKEIIIQYHLEENCHVYFSPAFGKLSAERIVTFMIENQLKYCNLQLQLHKYIWDPKKRGV